MAVITISRQLGSGGAEVARQVAQGLGYEFVDKRTIEGIFRQYGLTKFDEVYMSTPGILDLVDQDNLLIVSMLNEILEAVAQRGNIVILGRGGFAVLSDCVDVLKVRIQAPPAVRAQRIMAREHLRDLAAAEERINEDDKMHRKWVQTFYNRRWDDESSFDLVIDTGAIGIDAAVEEVLAAARAMAKEPAADPATTTAGLKVDPVLVDAIVKVLASPLPALPNEK
jgi:cytidylate kinase